MPTVLIVDDDPAIVETLQVLLEDEGYAVVTAYDGVEARERLSSHPCDLVIADLMMPRLDGRELRKAIASDPAHRHIPVVLITAASNLAPDDRQQFTAVLPKPFHLDTMARMVAQLLLPAPSP